MLAKMFVRSLAGSVVLGLLLFLPAGTLAWTEGWVFLALFGGCSLATGVWLQRTDPGLLSERMRSPFSADQKLGDRIVIALIMVVFCAWLVFMAHDARRFAWSAAPLWAKLLGAALIVVAFCGWVVVLRANSFASVAVRVQQDRGQRVISTGPYAVVRHPMYAYAVLFMIGTPLLLGSLWGLAWLALFIPLLAARTLGEEAMLMDELPGYRDYAAKVRFRLVPGIW
jgi:protein-S-isoprenylcysteine O-methyltransferase Ste14